MKILVWTVGAVLACCGVVITLFVMSAPPSTSELDGDLARIREEIASAERTRANYDGGLIRGVIDTRLEVLRTNEAFLQMKRDAVLRRVDLRYVVDGLEWSPRPERIAAIEQDIAKARADLEQSHREEERYSGGLVRSLATAQVATHELTLAQLQLALMAERHGLLLSPPSGDVTPDRPVGKETVTNDGDAL